MKKDRTVASRLPEHMVRDLELVEEVEQTDRATAVRKLDPAALMCAGIDSGVVGRTVGRHASCRRCIQSDVKRREFDALVARTRTHLEVAREVKRVEAAQRLLLCEVAGALVHAFQRSDLEKRALTRLFVGRLGDRAVVQPQNPILLDYYSEPEPDVSLLRPKADFYAQEDPMPEDVLLVIEVADASLARDRMVKVPLYARAGVPEVWIVNLQARRIEVFRGPSQEGYRESRWIDDSSLSPLAFPDLALRLDDLLG